MGRCAPIKPASLASAEEIATAVRERRAMTIYTESAFGSEAMLCITEKGERPDVLFTYPIPKHLERVQHEYWDKPSDVLQRLGVEDEQGRPRIPPPPAPPAPPSAQELAYA